MFKGVSVNGLVFLGEFVWDMKIDFSLFVSPIILLIFNLFVWVLLVDIEYVLIVAVGNQASVS